MVFTVACPESLRQERFDQLAREFIPAVTKDSRGQLVGRDNSPRTVGDDARIWTEFEELSKTRLS